MNDLSDILDFVYYNPTALASGASSVGLEETIGMWKGSFLLGKIKGQKYSDLKKLKESDPNAFKAWEWEAIEGAFTDKQKKKDLPFDGDVSDLTKAWKDRFAQGGLWDIQPGMSPTSYARTVLGSDEAYEMYLLWLLSEKNNAFQEAGMMKEGGVGYYTKDEYDAQGNKISGTVIIRLEGTDGSYRDIPTVIEDGVMKAFANTSSLQLQ